MQATNVIADTIDFTLERWSSELYYFRWKYPKTVNYLDWSTVLSVRMDVKDASGAVVLSYSLGSGFTIFAEDKTYLHLLLGGEGKNLAPGSYTYDVKITFSETVSYRPWRGNYSVVNVITK